MPRDWKKIETDYMGGNLSYAKIAEKWGVSVRQVEEHGRKNHWTEKRREFRGKVAARAEQKAIDKRASREAEKLARLDEAAGLMLEGIARALREDPEQLRRHKRKDGEIILDMLNGGNAAALAKALEIADELGLDTFNADSYIGWAETGTIADGQKFLATITHTDVVPEGNGWDADPYTVRVRDGWLLGRGVADDKGPSILCLYALKYLKDSGVQLKYPVRALLGANEETNMHDVDYYAEHYPMPAFCFTPDAEFPVCNGEKGGFNGELVSPKFENGIITAFEGGVAHNAVPDRASCTVQVGAGALVQTEGVTFEAGEGGTTVIRGWGKSGHAAMPEGTVNAISLIVNCLLKSGVCTPQEEAYLNVLHTLHADTDGSALGIAADDGLFDPLTIIGGTIEMADGVIRQSFDCRYPTNTDPEKMTAAIRKVCGGAATLENVSSRVPFYIDADSPAIQTLINTYNDVTGEGKKPFTMGGGTYARHFPYAVSFGPEHSDMVLPEFGGPMHGANEAAPIDKLLEALKIYIITLLRLEEIDF